MARRLSDRGLTLEVTPQARQELARAGYDPQFGARPLKRLIQRELLDPLALRLLEGEFPENRMVIVDWDGREFAFRAVAVGEVVAA